MNEQGRELLVQAALKGHKQVKGIFHHDHGECVMGVLHLSMHQTREEALGCQHLGLLNNDCFIAMLKKFDITSTETHQIMYMNDYEGMDFLAVARKLD